MRLLVLAVVVTAIALMPEPAEAQWQEYVFLDLGVAKEFPAVPVREDVEYQTVIIGDAPVPAVVYSVDEEDIRFKMTVVELGAPGHVANSANIMGECYFVAEQEGRVLANVAQRIEDGTEFGVHGRITTVDIVDQGRKQTSCFYAKGRLFKTEATVPHGHPQSFSPLATRFVTSLRFDVDRYPQ